VKKIIGIGAFSLLILGASLALVGPGNSALPQVEPAYVKECGACHIPYPAQYLPKRSWERILGSLDKHFGENATLSPKALQPIKAYLDSHAADSAAGNPRILREIEITKTPVRITEMPFWIHIHRKQIDRKAFDSPKVKNASNGGACHRGAAKGQFGDDD
jgi:Dihaem cytochrome c